MTRPAPFASALLLALLVSAAALQGCDSPSSITAGDSSSARPFIQGARVVERITDPVALREDQAEYDGVKAFAAQRPIRVEAIQIEELNGHRYRSVIAKDKDGMCLSSYEPIEEGAHKTTLLPPKNYCLNRNCTDCSAIVDQHRNFVQCSDCGSTSNPEHPGWCDHYMSN